MIEIGEVRQVVHAYPFQGLPVFETVAHRFEIRAVGPNLFVAIHTDGGLRHSGRRRRFDSLVTIATIDAVITDVMLMTKLSWLLALDVSSRIATRWRDFR